MGTRNLIAVVNKGKYKIAQYGQWDGYPDGQGIDCLNFLRNELNKKLFLNNIDNMVKFGTKEELRKQWNACGANDTDSRDTGADILSIVQNTKKSLLLDNNIDFVTDSLFCEWGYVIDFDKNTFEVYEGYNQKPLTENERFINFKDDSITYYPIKHVISFDIDKLPSNDEFLENFNENET